MTRIDTNFIAAVSADLADMLGDDFDPETFWDTLDGETDALDIADRLLSQRAEAKALTEAAKTQAAELSKRASRIAARASAFDKALFALLDATGQNKLERPAATVSRRKGSLSVHITDESAVPSQLCKTTVAPDKTAIKAQLQAGEDVPGAELVRGDDGVTVRVA
ncbi:siphovirus Gp157 family protein [Mameliella alba]|uniref:siphovirus Gp157 family protein n=1 Tax=Mameliella alba TaxID=561184 RepID=UPI0013FD579B|nr:siphovirus Gp157 family protein [Mameliella alba]